jgi:hypothetical protein
VLLAHFAREDPACAREHEGGHMGEAFGAKADRALQQTVRTFQLEALDSRGTVQGHQLLAQRVKA